MVGYDREVLIEYNPNPNPNTTIGARSRVLRKLDALHLTTRVRAETILLGLGLGFGLGMGMGMEMGLGRFRKVSVSKPNPNYMTKNQDLSPKHSHGACEYHRPLGQHLARG